MEWIEWDEENKPDCDALIVVRDPIAEHQHVKLYYPDDGGFFNASYRLRSADEYISHWTPIPDMPDWNPAPPSLEAVKEMIKHTNLNPTAMDYVNRAIDAAQAKIAESALSR